MLVEEHQTGSIAFRTKIMSDLILSASGYAGICFSASSLTNTTVSMCFCCSGLIKDLSSLISGAPQSSHPVT